MKKNKDKHCIIPIGSILGIILILLLSIGNTVASNYVKVATFGTLPTRNGDSISQKNVDRVIRFWERRYYSGPGLSWSCFNFK